MDGWRKWQREEAEDAHEAEEAKVDEEGPVGEAVGKDEGGKSSCCDPSERKVEWLIDGKVSNEQRFWKTICYSLLVPSAYLKAIHQAT